MPRQLQTDLARAALSLRGLARLYGFDRAFLGELYRTGELPGVARGRTIYVLRSDFEAWFRRQAVRPGLHAERVVERILDREAGP